MSNIVKSSLLNNLKTQKKKKKKKKKKKRKKEKEKFEKNPGLFQNTRAHRSMRNESAVLFPT